MSTTTPLLKKTILFLLLLLPGGHLLAQSLDPSFHMPRFFRNAAVVDAMQQADGKWVMLGNFYQVENQAMHVALVRYNTNGTLDQSFVQNASSLSSATTVQQLPNGQLLLLNGRWQQGSTQRAHLVRLNADGTLDPSLNVPLPSGPINRFMTVELQPDGKMLVGSGNASGVSQPDLVMRLLPDGSRDPGFNIGAGTEGVQDIAVQPDGKILIGGYYTFNSTTLPGVSRLLPDGSLDTSFRLTASLSGYVASMALLANGSLLVACQAAYSGGGTTLTKVAPNGAPDASFALPADYAGRTCRQVQLLPSGQVLALFNSTRDSAGIPAVAVSSQLVRLQSSGARDASWQPGAGADYAIDRFFVQPNGQVLVAGRFSNVGSERRSGVALLQSNGQVAPGLAPRLEQPAGVRKVARLPNGGLVVVGQFNTIDEQFADGVACLLPNGQLDPAFTWRQPRQSLWDWEQVAVQPDGRVLVAGLFGQHMAPVRVVRLQADGRPDLSFAASLPAVTGRRRVGLLKVQPDGKVLVSGDFINRAGQTGLTRLWADGRHDNSFTLPAGEIYATLLQADGRLMARVPQAGSTSFTLVRLLPGGAPDPGFGVSAATPDIGGAAFIRQQPGGQYVAAGFFGSNGVMPSPALVQLSAAGTENGAFSSPVRSYHVLVPELGVRALEVQADGKILVGGQVRLSTSAANDLKPLVRLLPDGQLDAGFDLAFLRGSAGSTVGSGTVTDLLVEPGGAVVAAGGFRIAGGQPSSGLVRLLPAGVLAVNPARAALTEVWPVPAGTILNLRLDATASPRRVTLLNALGKEVLSQPAGQTELTLNTEALARGLYVLRIDYATGPVTRRVVLK